MDSLPKIRANNFSNSFTGSIGKGPMYGSYSSSRHVSVPQDGLMHHHHGHPITQIGSSDNVTTLAEDFSRVNLQNTTPAAVAKATQHVPVQASDYHGMPTAMSSQHINMGTGGPLSRQQFVYNPHIVYPSSYLPHPVDQTPNGLATNPAMLASVAPQYYVHGNYANPHHMVHNHSPLSQGWTSRATSGEMPTLITPPRDSISSNEGDGPGTPFTQYTGYGAFQGGLAFMDRSPHSIYAWSTPSPASQTYAVPKVQITPPVVDKEILRLIGQTPAIPPAVPSTTPLKSLDRCLENSHGITNVYVRGLQPNTTDEMLYNLASRFGEIASSKSIIDHATGLCKGYGFVKYHNYTDAMRCIKGFHAQGYETSFARESFYSQLKKLSDENNTNLYVSNLPKEMNEHELGAIFAPLKVCSSRILRDGSGNGRGVGFARFESREACEEVIKTFNNTPFTKGDGREYLIQIRFADTQEQKHLKQQTTQARDWRTQEYEAQTTGRAMSIESFNRAAAPGPNVGNDFETYMTRTTGSVSSSGFGFHPDKYGRFARERLNTVTNHLSPQTSPAVAHVNLPTAISTTILDTQLVVAQNNGNSSENDEHVSSSLI